MNKKSLRNKESEKIVDIRDFWYKREEQIERWLEEEIRRKYGEEGDILHNPMIRIIAKFDGLDSNAQYELYGYAKGRIQKFDQDLSLRDKFWSVLEKGGIDDGSWKDMEEFADTLLVRERVCKIHEAVQG